MGTSSGLAEGREARQQRIAAYGTWPSRPDVSPGPGRSRSLLEVKVDGADVYWLEGRGWPDGHQVAVRWEAGHGARDVSAPDANVRSRVYEYGGGSYAVSRGSLFYTRFDTGRVYRCERGTELALTPPRRLRFADLVVDEHHARLLCVQESREAQTATDQGPLHSIVGVALDGSGAIRELAGGADFYSSPRVSPDGRWCAWISWNRPNMPWDGSELWVAAVEPGGGFARARRVAGGPAESVGQPEWSPAGELYFVSDRTGWWNLYRDRVPDGPEPVAPMEAEFCHHQWRFARPTYVFLDHHRIVAIARHDGRDELVLIDQDGGTVEALATPFTDIEFLSRLDERRVVFVGGQPQAVTAVVRLDVASGEWEALRQAADDAASPEEISVGEFISFPVEEGEAYGFFYQPRNPTYEGPPGERPPLVVRCHGGPTSNAANALDADVQALTSRGIAVLDVDHGGSTGYGRPYRDRLLGQWGVVDVRDCVAAVRHVAERGLADPNRVAITGKSAGGWTTLCALAFTDAFRGGAAYFAITDLEAWRADTHKFESRYLDHIVGPYPDTRERYLERSPTRCASRIAGPVLLVQGLDDHIVPREQAELMIAALAGAGRPYRYLTFEGEGHGLKRAENLEQAFDAELALYGEAFGIPSLGRSPSERHAEPER